MQKYNFQHIKAMPVDMMGDLRLSPAISGYLPAIFQISAGVSLFCSVFSSVMMLISLHEMLCATMENLLWRQSFGSRSAVCPSVLQAMADQIADSQLAKTEETQLADLEETLKCQKCGSSTKESEGAVPKALGQVYCKWCANIYQMLYRHLGGLPQTLATMSAAEQQGFWKKSSELIQATPRNGRWSLVRSSLVSELCRFKKEQTTRRVRREFKPLSVWQTEGYDIALLQEKGEKEENPVPALKYLFLRDILYPTIDIACSGVPALSRMMH